ncbi:MAG TPA: sigma-70 family RNA polymerase sigma factor [Candidatus Dormibacteraeota bacterium]|nr:sigma-70 family RNA polymerase sigma factor [Candidatus Dormibacteraeota bacterium]
MSNASEFAGLACDHLDDLCTYAAHLVGDADDALEFVAAGINHAMRYPPARVRVDGRVALLRAVTNACRNEQRFPPRPSGPARIFRRHRPTLAATAEAVAAQRINTVKRALGTLPFDRRAAILLRDLERLTYRDMARALECSPEAASRLLAGARREFGSVYREIAL